MEWVPTVTIAFLLACNERTQEDDCYKPNPDPGAMLGSIPLVCGHPFGYHPPTPEGLGLEDSDGPYHVIFCESEALGSTCDSCPLADVNIRITEHILEVMEQETGQCEPARVDHALAECVTTEEKSTETSCCFNAWYWGSCNIKNI